MGIIKVRNIRLYAYHGCLDEEGKIGSEYRIDLAVKTNLSKSAKSDHLSDTIDYVQLNQIIKQEMSVRTKLLETVADKILTRIISEIPLAKKATVEVSKVNPPIGGNVALVTIKMSKKK